MTTTKIEKELLDKAVGMLKKRTKRTLMPFGKYKNQRLQTIPKGYYHFLLEKGVPIKGKILAWARYVCDDKPDRYKIRIAYDSTKPDFVEVLGYSVDDAWRIAIKMLDAKYGPSMHEREYNIQQL